MLEGQSSRSDCGLDFLELAGSGAALPGIGILASNDCRGLILLKKSDFQFGGAEAPQPPEDLITTLSGFSALR